MSRRKRTRDRGEVNECSGFKPIRVSGRSLRQKSYIQSIDSNCITLATGPAGSGKTHIAVGMAVSMLRDKEVDRIVLSRPAVDSGTSIGYLPGTMEEKMHPYLAPLYDELHHFVEPKAVKEWIDRGVIDIVPLSMMRGRTFNNSFIILDEAQNALIGELRMCLTRIGMNSRMVITGDLSQSDLYDYECGGLAHCVDRLRYVDGIGVAQLAAVDIVRHPLIGRIEEALK